MYKNILKKPGFLKKSNRNAKPELVYGFTLIEMMASVTIFSIVMLVAIGSLLTITDANRKARATQAVINNMNFVLEGISREARVGTTYYCYPGNPTAQPDLGESIKNPQDCAGGGTILSFEPHDGDPLSTADQVMYRLNNTHIERSLDGGTTFITVTASNVSLDDFKFYVFGSTPGDNEQPRIFITVRGTAGVSDKVKTKFNLSTSITQRVFDL